MDINQTNTAGNLKITTQQDVKNPKTTYDYYVAVIAEERQGKLLPIAPIKLMAQCPEALGVSVGDMLMRRFQIQSEEHIQKVPRLKMILVELRDSYLVIRLEPPMDQGQEIEKIHARGRAFSLFHRGMRSAINLPKPPPIIRRRKPGNSAY